MKPEHRPLDLPFEGRAAARSDPRSQKLPIRAEKRLFDLSLAAALLLLLSPLALSIAALLWIERHLSGRRNDPIFYGEERISHGRPFTMWKFRTARAAALAAARAAPDFASVKVLERDDANLTRVGRWLKNYYLDELPQLANILRGDMSFVGPRPCPPQTFRQLVARGRDVNRLVPGGLTGPVQVRKGRLRGDAFPLDLEYVDAYRQMNPGQLLAYDVSLLWRTLRVVAEGKGC